MILNIVIEQGEDWKSDQLHPKSLDDFAEFDKLTDLVDGWLPGKMTLDVIEDEDVILSKELELQTNLLLPARVRGMIVDAKLHEHEWDEDEPVCLICGKLYAGEEGVR